MSRLTPETLRAYLDDELSEAERSETEALLSQCASSRRRLVQQHQARLELSASSRHPDVAVPEELLETARAIGRRQRSHAPRWVGPLAAAALVVLAVGGWQLDLWNPAGPTPSISGTNGRGDILRSDGPGEALTGSALVTPLGPKDGAILDGNGVTLRWSVNGRALETTLTLVDGLGNPVWQGEVGGTSWKLEPEHLDSMPPGTLYWFVTVRLDDGTTAETALRALRRP